MTNKKTEALKVFIIYMLLGLVLFLFSPMIAILYLLDNEDNFD